MTETDKARTTDDTPRYNSAISNDERKELAKSWIRGLLGVRDQLDGVYRAEVENIISYLDQQSGFAVPIINKANQWGIQRWRFGEPTNVYLVPLVESDKELHTYFVSMLKKSTYHEAEQAIYLPPITLSPTWQGLLLYHELLHSLYHRDKVYRNREDGFWLEEYEVYQREIRLVRALYGQKYKRVVYRLSKDHEHTLAGMGQLTIGGKYAPASLLEKAYGAAVSEDEQGVQRTVLLLDSVYRALDRLHPGDPKSRHASFTQYFYENARS